MSSNIRMRWMALVALFVTLTAAAQDPQRTAKSGDDNNRIRSVPTNDNYSVPIDSIDYDNPMAHPGNRPAAPICDPEQIEVKIGSDNASNGQHGIPISFHNGSNLTCSFSSVMVMQLENSSVVQERVRQGTAWVMKTVTRYRPVPITTCQNCGGFHFTSSIGQEIVVEPDAVVYAIIGFSSLNSAPCADPDTFSWLTRPGSQMQHVPLSLHVCAPLRFSGIIKNLPDGFLTP